jgi:hypothetical protein
MPPIDAFDPRKPFGVTKIRSPFTRTLLPARSRFSGSRRRPTTSATEHDTRAHPASHRSSRASGAFGPATRRHQPMPVALAHGCVAASRACEPRLARRGLRTRRSTGVDWASRGPKDPREGRRAVGRTLCVPFSERSVHPGHLRDSLRSLDRPASRRAGRDSSGERRLAKGCALG